MSLTRLVLSCLFVVATAFAAAAQGLGALAADTEAQRRARGGSAAPVFSNDNLPSQSRLEAALRDFELTLDVYNRVSGVQTSLHNARQRNPKLNSYLASFDNVGAVQIPLAEQAQQFEQIYYALDSNGFTPFTYEVATVALERAVIDAARSDAELKTMDPARQAMAAFARKHKQILANARWAESERKRTLPRPSPR